MYVMVNLVAYMYLIVVNEAVNRFEMVYSSDHLRQCLVVLSHLITCFAQFHFTVFLPEWILDPFSLQHV